MVTASLDSEKRAAAAKENHHKREIEVLQNQLSECQPVPKLDLEDVQERV